MNPSHILQLLYQRGCHHRNPDILLSDQTRCRFFQFLKCSRSVLAFAARVNVFLLCIVTFPSATVWDAKSCTVSQDASTSDVNHSSTLLKCLWEVSVQHYEKQLKNLCGTFYGILLPALKKADFRSECHLLYTTATQRIFHAIKYSH